MEIIAPAGNNTMSNVIHDHSTLVQESLRRQREEIAAIVQPRSVESFQRSANISLKYRYLFCETPKAACSTVKLTLFRAELEDDNFVLSKNRQIHIHELSPLLNPMMVPNLSERLNALFKFCFVRDPAIRLLSAYLDKIVRNKPQKLPVLTALNRSDDPGYQISFPEFVEFVCNQDPAKLDPHWSVQYYQVFADRLNYDFVGRFENFELDFRTILSQLGIEDKYFQSALSHQTNSSAHQSKYLTPALRNKIESQFSLDYETFGY